MNPMRNTILLTLLAVVSASFAQASCEDPVKLGKVGISAPQIVSESWDADQGVHQVILRVPKMSDGNWPARVQVLATESPWMSHTEDCRSRSKDKVKTCFSAPFTVSTADAAKPEAQFTLRMTRLPEKRGFSLFARALPCASDKWPHASGWNSAAKGVVKAQPLDLSSPYLQPLQVRNVSKKMIVVSALIPKESGWKLRIMEESVLAQSSASSADYYEIDLGGNSSSSSAFTTTMALEGNAYRVHAYVLKSKIPLPNPASNGTSQENFVIQVYQYSSSSQPERTVGFREVKLTLQPDASLENLVGSLLYAQQTPQNADLFPTRPNAPTVDMNTWMHFAQILHQQSVTPELYDDLLVSISSQWSKLKAYSSADRIAKLDAAIASLDKTANEPWVLLDFDQQGTLPLYSRIYARLQILNDNIDHLWKPGRLFSLARSDIELKTGNGLTSNQLYKPYAPGKSSSEDAAALGEVKGFLDSGVVLESSVKNRYLISARFEPRYFQMVPGAKNNGSYRLADSLVFQQAVHATESNIIGQEIVNGKQISGKFIVQSGTEKAFELRDVSRKNGYYDLQFQRMVNGVASATSCLEYVLGSVTKKEKGQWRLTLVGLEPMPAHVRCTMTLVEKEEAGKPVMTTQRTVVSSTLLFSDMKLQEGKTLFIESAGKQIPLALQVHPAVWEELYGSAPILQLTLSDPDFQVKRNGVEDLFGSSANLAYAGSSGQAPQEWESHSSSSEYFQVTALNAGLADFEAKIVVNDRPEPLLSQKIKLSSVQIGLFVDTDLDGQIGELERAVDKRTGPGIYMPFMVYSSSSTAESRRIRLEYTPPTVSDGKNWKMKLVARRGNGSFLLTDASSSSIAFSSSAGVGKSPDIDVPMGSNGQMDLFFTAIQGSQKLGDIQLEAVYGYEKNNEFREMDRDTIVFTNGSCETYPTFTYPFSGQVRYEISQAQVDAGYPDRQGNCRYSNADAQFDLGSFRAPVAPTELGNIQSARFNSKVSFQTGVLDGLPRYFDLSGGLGGFLFGVGNAYSGNIQNAVFKETILWSSSSASSTVEGYITGSILQTQPVAIPGGFNLELGSSSSGLTANFRVDFPSWKYSVSNIAGVRIRKDYALTNWYSSSSVTVVLANYHVPSGMIEPLSADNGLIRSSILRNNDNLLGWSASSGFGFIENATATRFEYDMLYNRLTLQGATDIGLEMPVNLKWFGFGMEQPSCAEALSEVDLLATKNWYSASSTGSPAGLTLSLHHASTGAAAGASFQWDDFALCGDQMLFHHLASDAIAPASSIEPPLPAGAFWTQWNALQFGASAAFTVTLLNGSRELAFDIAKLHYAQNTVKLWHGRMTLAKNSANLKTKLSVNNLRTTMAFVADTVFSTVFKNMGLVDESATTSQGPQFRWNGTVDLSDASAGNLPEPGLRFSLDGVDHDYGMVKLPSNTNMKTDYFWGDNQTTYNSNSDAVIRFGYNSLGQSFLCAYASENLESRNNMWIGFGLGKNCEVIIEGVDQPIQARSLKFKEKPEGTRTGSALVSASPWSGRLALNLNAGKTPLVSGTGGLSCPVSTDWPWESNVETKYTRPGMDPLVFSALELFPISGGSQIAGNMSTKVISPRVGTAPVGDIYNLEFMGRGCVSTVSGGYTMTLQDRPLLSATASGKVNRISALVSQGALWSAQDQVDAALLLKEAEANSGRVNAKMIALDNGRNMFQVFPLNLYLRETKNATTIGSSLTGGLAARSEYWITGTAESPDGTPQSYTLKVASKLTLVMMGYANLNFAPDASNATILTGASYLKFRKDIRDLPVPILVGFSWGDRVFSGLMNGSVKEEIRFQNGVPAYVYSGEGTITTKGLILRYNLQNPGSQP